jgi:HlyD family secretion protein
VGRKGKPNQNQIFILTGEDAEVRSRPVKIGTNSDGKVVILSGLDVGEQFVTRSGRPLKDRSKVVLSALSERPQNIKK